MLRKSLFLLLWIFVFFVFTHSSTYAEEINVPTNIKAFTQFEITYSAFEKDKCYIIKIVDTKTNSPIPPSSSMQAPCYTLTGSYSSSTYPPGSGKIIIGGLPAGNYQISVLVPLKNAAPITVANKPVSIDATGVTATPTPKPVAPSGGYTCDNRSPECPTSIYPSCKKNLNTSEICNTQGGNSCAMYHNEKQLDCAYKSGSAPTGPNTCGIDGKNNCSQGFTPYIKDDGNGSKQCICWDTKDPTPTPTDPNRTVSCAVCPDGYNLYSLTENTCFKDRNGTNQDNKPPLRKESCAASVCTQARGCNYTGGSITPPAPPCIGAVTNEGCKNADTAIGSIATDPTGFVKQLFTFLLSLSGGIAVLIIIAAGYKFMTSQGNPEAVKGAQEMLTSAIAGLLFIIFSFVILQVIGVDFLHIPGFS